MHQQEQDTSSFTYTYSGREQAEIKRIRDKYTPPSEKKATLERLRELDKSVTRKGTIVSLCLGIIGVLIMGAGMSLVMVFEGYFLLGVVLGLLGMAILLPAYPVYVRITEKERKRITPEILRLADELERISK